MDKQRFCVKECSLDVAKTLVKAYHYLGGKGFRKSICFGLYDNLINEFIGVAVFHGVSAPETVVGAFGLNRDEQEGIWELGRLVLKSEFNGKNFGSFLVGRSLRLLKRTRNVRAVISYASADKHLGYIYQATNWTYCGMTSKKKDFWVNGKKQERGKTKGVDGVWVGRPRKHRYIMLYDKTLSLKWEVHPYPKGCTLYEYCYGCEGDKQITNRSTGKTYTCPICTGVMKLISQQTEHNVIEHHDYKTQQKEMMENG